MRLWFLVRTKMRLTWRMYTRHTLASVETILFLLIYTLWIAAIWLVLMHVAQHGLRGGFVPARLLFADVLTLVLIMWLAFALIGYRLNEGYDLNRLRIYPLPLNSIFFANLAGAMLDLSVVGPLSAFLAVFLAAGPTFVQFVVGLVFILLYLFFIVLCGQTIAVLLYVMLPKVSTVKMFVTAMIAVLIWSLVMAFGGFRSPESWFNFHIFFVPSGIEHFRLYPGGQIAIILGAILDGKWADIWLNTTQYTIQGQVFVSSSHPLLGFAAWTLGVLVLNYLLHASWMESDIKGRVAVSRVRENDPAALVLTWLSGVLSPVIGPAAFELYRKDMLEYAFRSPYFLIYKFLPGTIAPIIIVLAMKWNLDPASGLITGEWRSMALTVTVVLILFIVIGQANLFAGNQFGFEDMNIRTLMSLPTPRKELLIGKNVFFAGLFTLDALVVSALGLIFFPGPYTFFATLSLMLTMFLLILSIGNFTSSIWPYWMPLDKPSFTLRSTVILGIVNSGVMIALAIAFALPAAMVILPHVFGLDWLAFIMMPLAVAYGVCFHNLTMGPAVKLFESNEFLILRRVADREQL